MYKIEKQNGRRNLNFWPRHPITVFYLDIVTVKRIWLINKEIGFILNFYFDVPCRTSPRCCSRGSPGGYDLIFLRHLYRYITYENSQKNTMRKYTYMKIRRT